MTEEPMRRWALLSFILINREGDLKIKVCNDHEMEGSRILREYCKAKTKIITLDFRRVNFYLFRDIFGGISWDIDLKSGPVKLVNIQISPSPGSRVVHSNEQETKPLDSNLWTDFLT